MAVLFGIEKANKKCSQQDLLLRRRACISRVPFELSKRSFM